MNPSDLKTSKIGLPIVGLSVAIIIIVIGVVYKNDCPAEPYISIFLLVSGISFPIVYAIKFLGNFIPEKKNRTRMLYLVVFGTTSGFFIVWLIMGSYWVYKIFVPNYSNKNAPNYCHPVIHVISSILVIVIWILGSILYLETRCFSINGTKKSRNKNSVAENISTSC